VSRFSPGDEVFGISRGSFAEYVAVLEGKLARKSSTTPFRTSPTAPGRTRTTQCTRRASDGPCGQRARHEQGSALANSRRPTRTARWNPIRPAPPRVSRARRRRRGAPRGTGNVGHCALLGADWF